MLKNFFFFLIIKKKEKNWLNNKIYIKYSNFNKNMTKYKKDAEV